MHLLWITCDELTAYALHQWGDPATRGRTPNIDRLCAEGTRFSNAFVQMPKCIPNRGMLVTGRYAHCDGQRTMSCGAFTEGSFMLLDRQSQSLPRWLAAAGHRTALAGRNHLYQAEDASAIGLEILNGHHPAAIEPVVEPASELLRKAYYVGRVSEDSDPDTTGDGRAVGAMCEWIARSDDARPFAGFLDIGFPHPPYVLWPGLVDDLPDEAFPLPPIGALADASPVNRAWRLGHGIEALSNADRRLIRRAYASMVIYADRQIGRLLDTLDRCGLGDDTLVVFGSDHGEYHGHFGCYEKWDTALYDPVVQVPLVLRLPGRIPAGAVRNQLVECIDICPTIIELAGLPAQPTVHGRSLVPVLASAEARHREHVFSQGGVERRAIANPGRDYEQRLWPSYFGKQRTLIEHPEALLRAHMIRTRTHKLIYRLSGDHELYDLVLDPHELANRYTDPAYALLRNDLRHRLLDHLMEYQPDTPPIHEIWA